MERRIEALEQRLRRLEPGSPAPPPPTSVAPPAPAPRRALEITFGLNWLSRIAAVTVVLALAFFFEYASENHWIAEPARVALGLICGAVALFAGDRFWR